MSDSEAEVQAAEAVEQGTNLIRSHLSNHLDQNPDSSFVSWIATLHPENAEVAIDQRFLIPGNPWWTVYEGAKHDVPTATAVPVVETNFQPDSASTVTNPPSTAPPRPPHFCLRCSPIDLVVGISMSFAAILTVVCLEITSTSLYLVSALVYHIARPCSPPNIFTGLFYSIFMLLYWVFAMTDSILLVVSVFVTELLATTAWILSVCFGGIYMANHWHQYIRRTCHMVRWACRARFTSPPRHLLACCGGGGETSEFERDYDGTEGGAIPAGGAIVAETVVIDSVVVESSTKDAEQQSKRDSTSAKSLQ